MTAYESLNHQSEASPGMANMVTARLYTLFGLVLIMATPVFAGDLDIRLEGGGVWFSRNDVRIPGDEGTV